MVRRTVAAAEAGDGPSLVRWLHPRYADALGDRDRALAEVEALARRYPRRRLALGDLVLHRSGPSRARAQVASRLEVVLEGAAPSIRLEGPVRWELVRDQGFRVASGLLVELRDVVDLLERWRAALEANDVGALAELVHPSYADGTDDRFRALARMAASLGQGGLRIRPVAWRIELRPRLVHVDAYARLRREGARERPWRDRLTLAPSAGRLRIRAGLRPPGA